MDNVVSQPELPLSMPTPGNEANLKSLREPRQHLDDTDSHSNPQKPSRTASIPKKSLHQLSTSSLSTTDLEEERKVPSKRQHRLLRHARHTFLNMYRRLFSLVFVFNMIGLSVLLSRNSNWTLSPPLSEFATVASANILVALLIRQDYVVNACFKATRLVPRSVLSVSPHAGQSVRVRRCSLRNCSFICYLVYIAHRLLDAAVC